jgi:hypothetical protein
VSISRFRFSPTKNRHVRIELDPLNAAQCRQVGRVVVSARTEEQGVDERCSRGRRAHDLIMPRYAAPTWAA